MIRKCRGFTTLESKGTSFENLEKTTQKNGRWVTHWVPLCFPTKY
jgi:hypothetical protein